MDETAETQCPACGGPLLGEWADEARTLSTGVWICESCIAASGSGFGCIVRDPEAPSHLHIVD